MSLPFTIYMNPPNILVFPTYSKQELTMVAGNVKIGEIIQINPSTTNFIVGDVVFYKQEILNTLFYPKSNTRYDMINENSIFFKEL